MEEVQQIASTDIMLYVTGCSMIIAALMTMLPKPKTETGIYAAVYKVLNIIAMNFGKAANK